MPNSLHIRRSNGRLDNDMVLYNNTTMKQSNFKRSKISSVCSWDAYCWLNDWIREQYPRYPYKFEANKYFYSNTSHREYKSKFIEDVITKVLTARGADPKKLPDKGHQIRTKNGKQIWIKQKGVKAGRADVQCFFNNSMYNLEVKVGADKQSDEQRREQRRAEANGEKYVIIKTIDDFIKLL